jgi:hypothetical protein
MYGMDSDKKKVIAIDFDDTITTTEAGWLRIMLLMEQLGFHVIVVTYRRPTEWPQDLKFLVDKGYKIYYTSRMAKKGYMQRQGIDVDIWIDDTPEAIVFDMDTLTGAFVPPLI